MHTKNQASNSTRIAVAGVAAVGGLIGISLFVRHARRPLPALGTLADYDENSAPEGAWKGRHARA